MGPSHQGAPSLPELGMQLGTWRVFSLLQAAQVPTLKRLSSYNEGGGSPLPANFPLFPCQAQLRARLLWGCQVRLQQAPSDICVCVCFALHPRCHCPLIVAAVTVPPAPHTVLHTYCCSLLVLESKSLHLCCLVCHLPEVIVSFLILCWPLLCLCDILFSFLEMLSLCALPCLCPVSCAEVWNVCCGLALG